MLAALGLAVVALGVSGFEAEPVVAAGLGCYGFGTAVWDVAMNVEGAEVERHLGRTVLPRFHAAWSFGSIAGAGIGVVAAKLGVPLPLHFMVVGVATLVAALVAVRAFLAIQEPDEEEPAANDGRPGWSHARSPSARWCWRSRSPRARPTTGSPWPWSTATTPSTAWGWPVSRCS